MENKQYIKLNIDIPDKGNATYPILIGNGILIDAGNIVKQYVSSSKLLVVSNDIVFPLYGKQVIESLRNAGFKVKTTIITDGEENKNLNWFKVIIDEAIDFKLTRKDAFIALGGGVIGDITGYAAASYLRGINIIQIGTTLLAQVDSSIGGKVAINHEKGKNLIGAFYQPKCVITDVTTLKTLDNRNLKSGLAEVLKYSFIEKSTNYLNNEICFFDFLDKNKSSICALDYNIVAEMISHCCKLKASVVEQDEREAGLRAILNLGHTIGHALEVCGEYNLLLHGEAISIGMVTAIKISEKIKLIDESIANNAVSLILKYDLPYNIPKEITIEDIVKAMKLDKKVSDGKIRFILPTKKIGIVDIFDNIKDSDLVTVLESMY